MTLNKVDDVLEEVEKVVKQAFRHGCLFSTCSECGQRRQVIAHVVDMSTECAECLAKRLYKERTRPKLDVADFARV